MYYNLKRININMRKLTQKELVNEGFGSLLGGLARTARNATGAVAKAIAPTYMGALGKGASLAAGAIENIRSGSPTASAGTFLDSEDGKRTFKDVKLGKETKLSNQNFKIQIKSGYYLNSLGGDKIEEKDVTGGYIILRRKNRGGGQGFDNEIVEVWDTNGKLNTKPIKAGTELPKPATGQDGAPDKPGADGTKPATGQDGAPDKPGASPEPETTDRVTTSNFKKELNNYKKNKLGESGIGYSQLAVSEFVRKLAKDANNTNVGKNLPKFMSRIKSDDNDWSNKELKELVNKLKFEGILQESQKNLLKHLQSDSQMNKWTIGQ